MSTPSAKRPQWDRVLAIGLAAGGKYKAQHDAVIAAFDAGELTGPRPTYISYWRRANPPRAPDAGSMASTSMTPVSAALTVSPEAAAIQTLKEATRELTDAAGRLTSLGLFTLDDKRRLQGMLKWSNATRLREMSLSRMETTALQYRKEAGDYRERAGEDEAVAIPAEESAASTLVVGLLGAPRLGDRIGRLDPTKTDEDALTRARIVTPVLTREMSAERAAEYIRDIARGKAVSDEMKDAFGEFPPKVYDKFRALTARTIQRWVRLVREDRRAANESGEAVRPLHVVLRHVQPAERKIGRKATDLVVQKLVQVYLAQPNFSKADVKRYADEVLSVELSTRHVQRLLGGISAYEEGKARGGPAGDVMFRAKLLRETALPNEMWIGDHSFLKLEHLDPDHPEYRDLVHDFDWEFDVAVEIRARQGVVERRPVPMHLTLWIDACTRRKMALRVWDHTPTGELSVAVLFDAIRKFGVPDAIYTDNGSNLRCAAMKRVTTELGIRHALSRPYSPEGRGKIERMFRTIKAKVLSRLPGYRGPRCTTVWAPEDLLTAEQVEMMIERYIDRYLDRVIHSETRRSPVEHYDSLIGFRSVEGAGFDEESAAVLIRLLPHETRKLFRFGIEIHGLPYWNSAFALIPHGAIIHVHFEPNRFRHVYVSVKDPSGDLRYVGRADCYDERNPPPEVAEVRLAEAEWTAYALDHEEVWSDERVRRAQIVEACRAGRAIAAKVLLSAPKSADLAPPAAPRLLPPAESREVIPITGRPRLLPGASIIQPNI